MSNILTQDGYLIARGMGQLPLDEAEKAVATKINCANQEDQVLTLEELNTSMADDNPHFLVSRERYYGAAILEQYKLKNPEVETIEYPALSFEFTPGDMGPVDIDRTFRVSQLQLNGYEKDAFLRAFLILNPGANEANATLTLKQLQDNEDKFSAVTLGAKEDGFRASICAKMMQTLESQRQTEPAKLELPNPVNDEKFIRLKAESPKTANLKDRVPEGEAKITCKTVSGAWYRNKTLYLERKLQSFNLTVPYGHYVIVTYPNGTQEKHYEVDERGRVYPHVKELRKMFGEYVIEMIPLHSNKSCGVDKVFELRPEDFEPTLIEVPLESVSVASKTPHLSKERGEGGLIVPAGTYREGVALKEELGFSDLSLNDGVYKFDIDSTPIGRFTGRLRVQGETLTVIPSGGTEEDAVQFLRSHGDHFRTRSGERNLARIVFENSSQGISVGTIVGGGWFQEAGVIRKEDLIA